MLKYKYFLIKISVYNSIVERKSIYNIKNN